MPDIGSRYDKELIFFAILLILNMLCDIIDDVVDKHIYVWWISLIGQFQKWLASVIAAESEHIKQHFDWCFRYCRYVIEIFIMCVVYTL